MRAWCIGDASQQKRGNFGLGAFWRTRNYIENSLCRRQASLSESQFASSRVAVLARLRQPGCWLQRGTGALLMPKAIGAPEAASQSPLQQVHVYP